MITNHVASSTVPMSYMSHENAGSCCVCFDKTRLTHWAMWFYGTVETTELCDAWRLTAVGPVLGRGWVVLLVVCWPALVVLFHVLHLSTSPPAWPATRGALTMETTPPPPAGVGPAGKGLIFRSRRQSQAARYLPPRAGSGGRPAWSNVL